MEKLLLVFLALFAVAFISVKSHGIGCVHGHGHHGGHHGGHHVGFVSLGSHSDGVKGQSDYEGFKSSLGGQADYSGYHVGHQGSFGDQIGYSAVDSGYHRALGGHQGNVAGQGWLGSLPTAHQGNLGGNSGISGHKGHGYQVSYRGRDGYQSSFEGQQRNSGSQDNLAGSTARQGDALGVHSITLVDRGRSRDGYKGGLGSVYQSSYDNHQGSFGDQSSLGKPSGFGNKGGVVYQRGLGDQNNFGKSDGFETKGGLGRSRSQSAYGGYDADHGGYGAHGGYIIQGY